VRDAGSTGSRKIDSPCGVTMLRTRWENAFEEVTK
jgi:hypothetical protein